jgi:uncharacterized protein (DUF2336 family)
MSTSEIQGLLALARDKSTQGRSALVATITDLYDGRQVELTGRDRLIMAEIIGQLLHEVEAAVRRNLAECFASRPDAPHDLVLALANDEIEVAKPVLARCEVLKDAELIDIIKHRTMEHQVAIALRPQVSERVSDALVETGLEQVITSVLSNQGAEISERMMDHLVEQSREIAAYQKPLVERHDLSLDLAKKLYAGVSTALREHIVENFKIDPKTLDDSLNTVVDRAVATEREAAESKAVSRSGDVQARPEDEHELLQLLRHGDVATFLDKFTSLSNLGINLVRRVLFEPGGEALAIVCKGIGLEKHAFVSIFMRFRQGRLGDKRVEQDELSRAVNFYDQAKLETAERLLERWRKDPAQLAALKSLGRS